MGAWQESVLTRVRYTKPIRATWMMVVFKIMVMRVLTYGMESWTLTEREEEDPDVCFDHY